MKNSLFVCIFLFATCQIVENQPVITELQGETLQMYEKGKKIFGEKCSSCHNENMITNSTGSALGGITQRRTKEWLHSYIRSPQNMLSARDPQAIELYNKAGVLMGGFPNLTDEQIDQILVYIEGTYHRNKIRLRPVER
jgi:mono/diheme cytochrome c family protein